MIRQLSGFVIALVVLSATTSQGLLLPQEQPQQQNDPAVQSQLNKGNEAFSGRRYRDAEKAFKEANNLGMGHCQPCLLALASTYARLGNAKAALENCDRAIDASVNDAQRASAHMLKAELLYAIDGKQKLKESESELRLAVQLDKQNAAYHFGLGLALMRQMRDAEGKQELESYLQLAPDRPQAIAARQLIANPRRARERYAPDFSALGLHNESIRLSEFAGKVLVLDFWATWCPPCVESVPEIKDLIKKYPPEKFAVVSISADQNEKAWRDFIEKKNMNWPHVLDRDHSIRESFGVNAFPTYLVIDGEGVIQEAIVGTDPRQSVAYRLRDKLKNMPELRSK